LAPLFQALHLTRRSAAADAAAARVTPWSTMQQPIDLFGSFGGGSADLFPTTGLSAAAAAVSTASLPPSLTPGGCHCHLCSRIGFEFGFSGDGDGDVRSRRVRAGTGLVLLLQRMRR